MQPFGERRQGSPENGEQGCPLWTSSPEQSGHRSDSLGWVKEGVGELV